MRMRAGVRHGDQLPAGRDVLLHARVLRLLLHLGLLPAPGARRLFWVTCVHGCQASWYSSSAGICCG